MTRSPALSCPGCERTLGALSWMDANHCRCNFCHEYFDFFPFPALVATREIARPQAVAVANDSTCFFHAENQAEKVCEECGRFLCPVCAVPFAGRVQCPTCIAAPKTAVEQVVTSRTLPGGTALAFVFVPMLIWPVTLLTAPIALGVAITGWKKPQSVVKPGRTKLIVAGVFATLQICGWAFLGVALLMKK